MGPREGLRSSSPERTRKGGAGGEQADGSQDPRAVVAQRGLGSRPVRISALVPTGGGRACGARGGRERLGRRGRWCAGVRRWRQASELSEHTFLPERDCRGGRRDEIGRASWRERG